MNGLDDSGGDLLERLEDLGRAERERARQAGHQAAALDLHDLLLGARIDAADGLFDLLRRALTDERVVLAAHIFDDRLVELVARDLDRGGLDDAAERDDRDVGRAAADVSDQIAVRPADVETRADGRRDRLLDEEHALRTGLRAGVDDRTLLDLGDDRGHADDDVRLEQAEALYLADELLDHQLGHLVVRNDALAQRTDGDDVVRRAAEGLLRLRADRHELSRHLVHRDD